MTSEYAYLNPSRNGHISDILSIYGPLFWAPRKAHLGSDVRTRQCHLLWRVSVPFHYFSWEFIHQRSWTSQVEGRGVGWGGRQGEWVGEGGKGSGLGRGDRDALATPTDQPDGRKCRSTGYGCLVSSVLVWDRVPFHILSSSFLPELAPKTKPSGLLLVPWSNTLMYAIFDLSETSFRICVPLAWNGIRVGQHTPFEGMEWRYVEISTSRHHQPSSDGAAFSEASQNFSTNNSKMTAPQASSSSSNDSNVRFFTSFMLLRALLGFLQSFFLLAGLSCSPSDFLLVGFLNIIFPPSVIGWSADCSLSGERSVQDNVGKHSYCPMCTIRTEE